MTHISPWRATEGLIAGVARILPPGGVLYLYGPYRAAATPPPPSNAAFDASLRARATRTGACVLSRPWPKRPGRKGLVLGEVVDMHANNLSLVFTLQ